MAIFTHRDCDGDTVEVLADDGDSREDLILLYRNRTGQRSGAIRVDRDAVLRLSAALIEWLGDTTAPIAPNSLIDQLIVKRVAEEVARVLPLHLSPLAFKSDAERAREEADGLWRKPGDCGTDPQHAKYEDAHSPLCGQCGQLWTDTHGQPGYPCVRKGDKVWGPDGLPSMEPYCTGCTHSWSRHVGAGGCGASMFGTTRLVCGCKRVQS